MLRNLHHCARVGALFFAGLLCSQVALAQQHAHVHGQAQLDVAIDPHTIAVTLWTPLDNLLGFERAPRTPAEQQQVTTLLTQLQAADALLQPDPQAQCTLQTVELESELLARTGHLPSSRNGHSQEHEHAHDEAPHADITVHLLFDCAPASRARFIDVQGLAQFARLQQLQVQVAGPQGQFQRNMQAPFSRLSLER